VTVRPRLAPASGHRHDAPVKIAVKIRLLVGGSYRMLLPLSLLCGAAFLVLNPYSLLDFSDAGEISVFIDEDQLELLDEGGIVGGGQEADRLAGPPARPHRVGRHVQKRLGLQPVELHLDVDGGKPDIRLPLAVDRPCRGAGRRRLARRQALLSLPKGGRAPSRACRRSLP
jgi:hypothetical protein